MLVKGDAYGVRARSNRGIVVGVEELERDLARAVWRNVYLQREKGRVKRLVEGRLRVWPEERRDALLRLGYDPRRLDALTAAEARSRKEVEELTVRHPLWPRVRPIKGFGPYLCGLFITAAGDVRRTENVSQFWSGMGVGLVNGKVPRKSRSGKPIRYKYEVRDGKEVRIPIYLPAHPFVLWVGTMIRECLLRAKGRFYQLYLEFKSKEDPNKPLIFRHKSALRKAQKVLYACLWKELREIHGLHATELYVFSILHHEGRKYTIEDFWDRYV